MTGSVAVKKGENFNHPERGSLIKVEPIRSTKSINSIKKLLSDRPRDYCLFVTGINTNLRASDLLQIKAGQVRTARPMDEIEIRERKTRKRRRVSLNKSSVEAIKRLLASREYGDDEPLFSGRGGSLTVPSVNRLVKGWCDAINLKGNFGSHSLRKTFGYHQRVTFGRGVAELMVVFNHSSEKQTLDYLCVQPEEIKSIYANEL
jgi:integrase